MTKYTEFYLSYINRTGNEIYLKTPLELAIKEERRGHSYENEYLGIYEYEFNICDLAYAVSDTMYNDYVELFLSDKELTEDEKILKEKYRKLIREDYL